MNYRNIIILFLTSIFITTTFALEYPDLDSTGYGSCDMWLGYGWTGDNCIGISGCDWNGDEAWFFQTIEECLSSCDTLGDLNSDGYLDILVNIVLGNNTPTDSQLWLGYINSDDIINILDIIAIANIILNP